MTITKPRLNRKQQAEANLHALLDAAREVFTAYGYHAATVEQVAAAAGFTTGAVFSRFATKADLFLALLERTVDSRVGELQRLRAAARPRIDIGEAWSRAWWEQFRRNPEWMLLVTEFRVHAARDPRLNARYAAIRARQVAAVSDAIAADLRRLGVDEDSIPADAGRIAMALTSGMVLEHWTLGEAAMGDMMARAGNLLFQGIAAAATAPSRPARRKRQ